MSGSSPISTSQTDVPGHSPAASAAVARQPNAAGRPSRVLVVDDDASVRRFTRVALERLGYLACEATSGSQALRALSAFAPDVVLLDLYMPEMDGIEVLQKLRANGCEASVIAMSGGAFGRNMPCLEIAAHLGAVGALAKPFSIDELAGVLAAVLEQP